MQSYDPNNITDCSVIKLMFFTKDIIKKVYSLMSESLYLQYPEYIPTWNLIASLHLMQNYLPFEEKINPWFTTILIFHFTTIKRDLIVRNLEPINTTKWYSTCHTAPFSGVEYGHTSFIQILSPHITILSCVCIALLFLLTHLLMSGNMIDFP